MTKPCFFCDVQQQDDLQRIAESEFCFSRYDDFPVSKGHAEIVSKRHIESVFDLTAGEFTDVQTLLQKSKAVIDEEYSPDGYTVGINVGEAGGQTIPHMHMHVIPRYNGDVTEPNGGVRNILKKGDYSDQAKTAGKEKYL